LYVTNGPVKASACNIVAVCRTKSVGYKNKKIINLSLNNNNGVSM
jgi:hypothetical protein